MFIIKYLKTITVLIFLFTITLFADFKPGEAFKSIKTKGVIRIGISKHYPPLNFNTGKKGLEVEMASKLAEFLGVRVKRVPLDVTEYITAITTKKVDIVIAGLSKDLVRAKKIWFSVPYITTTPGVLVNKRIIPSTRYGELFEKSPIKTIWDLTKLTRFTFAVKKGSSYETLLKNKLSNMQRVVITSNEAGLRLLKEGKVHGFVHDSVYLQYLYRSSARYRISYKLLQGGTRVEHICIGLPFGDTVLKNQVDLFVSEMIRQGQVDEWLKKFNE